MDLLDKQILCALEKNCRTPLSTIAKKYRVHRNVVSYRISNLQKKGFIKKYVTSLNLRKLGFSTYKIYFKTTPLDENSAFVKHLMNSVSVIHLVKLEGEFSYSCVVATKNIVELDDFLMLIKQSYHDLIKDIQVSIVVRSSIFKLEKILLGEKEEPLKIETRSSSEEVVSLDATDKKILFELSQDASISYVDLMKKTGYTLDIIKYRMKKLKSSLITSFRVLLDVEKLGFFHYTLLLRTQNMTKQEHEKLLFWCSQHPQVLYCTKRIGQFDFEINIAIQNLKEYRTFILDFEAEFSPYIDSYDTILLNEVLKLNYFPFVE